MRNSSDDRSPVREDQKFLSRPQVGSSPEKTSTFGQGQPLPLRLSPPSVNYARWLMNSATATAHKIVRYSCYSVRPSRMSIPLTRTRPKPLPVSAIPPATFSASISTAAGNYPAPCLPAPAVSAVHNQIRIERTMRVRRGCDIFIHSGMTRGPSLTHPISGGAFGERER